MVRCLVLIATAAACLIIAGSAESHSDAACIGYMEADFNYKAANRMADDVYADAKAKVDASHSVSINGAEAIRATALGEPAAALNNANAKANAVYKSAIDRIDAKFETARRKVEINEVEALSAYEAAVDDANVIRYSAIKKAELDYKFDKEKAADSRDKILDVVKERNTYNRIMKQLASAYQSAKKESDSVFGAMEARAKAILDQTMKKVVTSYDVAKASYVAAKQAAIATRDEEKRQALALYRAIKADPDVHYRAAVRKADGDRAASRKRIKVAYEDAKQKAKADRWNSYIDAYEGATSNISSIMEKVLNVDRHRCRLKFGD